jgi:hypothetical protein
MEHNLDFGIKMNKSNYFNLLNKIGNRIHTDVKGKRKSEV